jgi:hypothetical protein
MTKAKAAVLAIAAAVVLSAALMIVPGTAQAASCSAFANKPQWDGAYVHGNGGVDCTAGQNSIYLHVCIQAYDRSDGWIDLGCNSGTNTTGKWGWSIWAAYGPGCYYRAYDYRTRTYAKTDLGTYRAYSAILGIPCY